MGVVERGGGIDRKEKLDGGKGGKTKMNGRGREEKTNREG